MHRKRGAKTASLIVKTAAQFLRAAMRDMDHVARYNDDTFALLLPAASLDDAVKVGERLRQAIARCAIGAESNSIQFTVSVGVAQAERNDDTLKVLRRAQSALGMARTRGPNVTFMHDGVNCRLAPVVEFPTPAVRHTP
jgi:diguanylate cyclase